MLREIILVAGLLLGGTGMLIALWGIVSSLMGTPRQIFCRHGQWEPRGFSYIKCGKCGLSKYNPTECSKMHSAFLSMMVKRGYWGEEETRVKALQHGIPFTEQL